MVLRPARDLQPVAATRAAFVIADLHFGDEALCTRRSRPFASAAAMDAEIVRRWNSTIRDDDVVYILGDIGRRSNLGTARQLRGRKHLIAGNGDDLAAVCRSGIFASVSVARWLPGLLLTHIPVHPDQLRARTINVHGHLHSAMINDPRYVCVSVEQTNYLPVLLSGLQRRPPQQLLL